MTNISDQESLERIKQSYESRFKDVPSEMKDCINTYYKPNRSIETRFGMPTNAVTKFAEELLDKYGATSKEYVSIDMLDSFTEWLIIQLYEAQKERREEKMKPYAACSSIGKSIISPIDKI